MVILRAGRWLRRRCVSRPCRARPSARERRLLAMSAISFSVASPRLGRTASGRKRTVALMGAKPPPAPGLLRGGAADLEVEHAEARLPRMPEGGVTTACVLAGDATAFAVVPSGRKIGRRWRGDAPQHSRQRRRSRDARASLRQRAMPPSADVDAGLVYDGGVGSTPAWAPCRLRRRRRPFTRATVGLVDSTLSASCFLSMTP
jgi:hypothetical protein